MPNHDIQLEQVGEVYAQALMNLAEQQKLTAEITEEVHALKDLLDGQPLLAQFLGAATIDDDEKLGALDRIFGGRLHPLVLQTLKAMARRQRLIFLPSFFRAYDSILARLAGHIDVELTTASPLSPAAIDRIRESVGAALGKHPALHVRVDPGLIGGLRLRIADTLIDGSVQTQLEHIKEHLERTGAAQLRERMGAVVIS